MLDAHLQVVHVGEKAFKCEVCHCKYSYKGDLRKPKRIVYAKEKPT